MPRHLQLILIVLIIGICLSGCGGHSSLTPTRSPTSATTLIPISVGQAILTSDDINASNLIKVDGGSEISDSKGCPIEDCKFFAWNILEPDSLSIAIAEKSLDLVITLRSFQSSEDANSSAMKVYRENGGNPGIRLIDIPVGILPDTSFVLAEDGRVISLLSGYQNMVIGIGISASSAGLTDAEKAGLLMTNLAKLQIDKIIRLGNQ
ncbi:MAG: hypothetical protein ABI621_15195 [Chloroflexota bacterium]